MTITLNSSDPLGYMGLNPALQPSTITANRAPTVNDKLPAGTQWINQAVNPHVLYTTIGAGVWQVGANANATTTTAGITRYATYAEVSTGTGTDNATLAADV